MPILVKEGQKCNWKPVEQLTVGNVSPVSSVGMTDLNDSSKPASVSINTQTAKKVRGVPVFGTIIDFCKNKRGMTVCILFCCNEK